MKAEHRIIFGAIVTAPLNEASMYRSPILAYPFAKTVFDGREPANDLDITVSIEGWPQEHSGVSGHIEIVGGTIKMFENAIAAIKPKTDGKPAKEKGPLPHSFIQLGIGSPEFCKVFVRFWEKSIGNSAFAWAHDLLHEISVANLNDFVWVNIHSGPCKREEGAKIMLRNIASMIM